MAMLEYLRMRYTGIDLSNLDVSVPGRASLSSRNPCLRPSIPCSPPTPWICGSTARRSAIRARPRAAPPSPGPTRPKWSTTSRPAHAASFAQLHDAPVPTHARRRAGLQIRVHRAAMAPSAAPIPARSWSEHGTCRQELWPDSSEIPVTSERVLISDAEKHHLDATPHPIALDDVRKVLSAGCPGSRGDQHGLIVLRCRPRRPLQRRRRPQRPPRTPRDADRRLHRQLLHHQELVGRVLGR